MEEKHLQLACTQLIEAEPVRPMEDMVGATVWQDLLRKILGQVSVEQLVQLLPPEKAAQLLASFLRPQMAKLDPWTQAFLRELASGL